MPDRKPPGGKGLAFDENGPSLDGVRPTRRTRKGWQPAEQHILERELVNLAGLVAGDLVRRLDGVCRAMNMGDFATAAIAAEHATRDIKRKPRGAIAKASPDDPKHPGWPAGTPDGKGGRFRPNDDALLEAKDARIKRLASRRGLRSILRRVLTFKRVARIVSEVLGDVVPGLDAASGAATLIDAVKLAKMPPATQPTPRPPSPSLKKAHRRSKTCRSASSRRAFRPAPLSRRPISKSARPGRRRVGVPPYRRARAECRDLDTAGAEFDGEYRAYPSSST